MIFLKEFKIDSIDEGEVLRYMRAGNCPEGDIVDTAKRACARVLGAAKCSACYMRLPVTLCRGHVLLGELRLTGKSVVLWLDGCSEAYIFCATAGVGVDREIQRSAVTSVLESFACDCAGSVLVESVCDRLGEIFSEHDTVTNRFSTGYGDLPIEHQGDIVRLLDTKKHIGVSLTDGLMMTPTKSVVAIVGIKKRD